VCSIALQIISGSVGRIRILLLDLLHLDGDDVAEQPLGEREARLEELLAMSARPCIQRSPDRLRTALFAKACGTRRLSRTAALRPASHDPGSGTPRARSRNLTALAMTASRAAPRAAAAVAPPMVPTTMAPTISGSYRTKPIAPCLRPQARLLVRRFGSKPEADAARHDEGRK
jgi:hypothetical protein